MGTFLSRVPGGEGAVGYLPHKGLHLALGGVTYTWVLPAASTYHQVPLSEITREHGRRFPVPGDDAEVLFLAAVAGAHRWAPAADKFRNAANLDTCILRRILNQTTDVPSPPRPCAEPSGG